VIFGAVIDPNMDGEVQITVVATGFGRHSESKGKVVALNTHRAAPPSRLDGDIDIDEISRKPAFERLSKFNPPRFSDNGRTDSREIPAFLRNQMD
jgi:cell division protein FtsZ